MMNWEEEQARQQEKSAFYIHKGRKKCASCGWYDCICQRILNEFGDIK